MVKIHKLFPREKQKCTLGEKPQRFGKCTHADLPVSQQNPPKSEGSTGAQRRPGKRVACSGESVIPITSALGKRLPRILRQDAKRTEYRTAEIGGMICKEKLKKTGLLQDQICIYIYIYLYIYILL